MPIFPIGLQMYTVRELTQTPDSYRQLVREVAEMGYQGIEGGAPSDMTDAEFQAFITDLGLRVTSVWGNVTQETVQEVVDRAGVFGVKTIVGCWGADNFKDLDEVKKTADHFQTSAELLKPHGLEMAYHNHWYEFSNKVDGRYGWDVLFELAPDLKAEIDLYWASNFGEVDVPALVQKYANKTPLLHVKDGPLVWMEPNTACGKGKMDLPAGILAADPDRVQWLIVELDAYVGGAENMRDAVRDSIDYLKLTGLVA
jgi:sugar phosphate isomerase/epimerase